MIVYTYTWKGPKESLLGCYVTVAIVFVAAEENMEELIPKSKANVYFPRKDISSFNKYIDNIVWKLTDSTSLNREGDYALYKNKTRLLNPFTIDKTCYVKEVTNLNTWQERLTIIKAIDIWREKMDIYTRDYLEPTKFFYEDLERNKWAHKNYLKRLKILPSIYLWYKVVQLFYKEKYKPIWYKKEIDSYKKLIGE